MSELYRGKYRIPSSRLKMLNYGDAGMYFVTICTANRECFFGDIIEAQCIISLTDTSGSRMQLSKLGKAVESEWLKTAEIRRDMNLELAEYIVMPNHFHGIIIIGANVYNTPKQNVPVGEIADDSAKNRFAPQSKNLASIADLNRRLQPMPGITISFLIGNPVSMTISFLQMKNISRSQIIS
jgi:putative transposase